MINFILGIIFVIMIIPIAERITQVILTLFELWKSNIAIKITKNNEILEPKSTHIIGFCAPPEEEEDEDDDL